MLLLAIIWFLWFLSMDQTPSVSLPPLPKRCVIVGCGGLGVDFLSAVAAYPQPDAKIRSIDSTVQGGGNAANALTCAARLGLTSRLISKIADDSPGRGLLEELEADGVDTSFIVVSKEGHTPFTYVIVDNQLKTRTCIFHPGHRSIEPDDLSRSRLLSALDGARLFYSDARFPATALRVAIEATRKNIPILIDAEKKRGGLDDLLQLAGYVVCPATFPQEWAEEPSISGALVSMLLRLPKVKFVVVTLGGDGCIMVERSAEDPLPTLEETDVDSLLESLKQRKDDSKLKPTCFSSSFVKLRANGIGTVYGRLLMGTAERIPPEEIIDTTGAGDAFIGALLYAICTDMPSAKMLRFAAQVAAACCKALGARTGLPYRSDPSLLPFPG